MIIAKIKRKNKNTNKKPLFKAWKKIPFGKCAIVIAGILLCYVFYAIYIKITKPLPYLTSLSTQQQVAVGQTIGHAYRNIQGYKAVCADSDFELKNYPEEFKAAMADELDGLEQVLMRDNISLEQAFNIFIQGDILKQIQEELYNELKVIASPDDKGVASACQLLDADAADIAQNVADEIRPLYHETLAPLFKE